MNALTGILLLALLPVDHRTLRPNDAVTVHIPHKGTRYFVVRDMGWGWMLESPDGMVWNMHALKRHCWEKTK
jgi:hypothetical protein